MDKTVLFTQMREAIEIELKQTIDQFIVDKNSELHSMLCYHMGWQGDGAGKDAQGKRIRPVVTLLSAAGMGKDWRKALPAAAGVELLHNFSLIHDDIQDQSDLRRGRATVWNKWGIAQAINAGDALFTMAHLGMLKINEIAGAEIAVKASRILHQTAIEITNGQYLDLSFEKKPEISLNSYLNMINGKTAALLGCSAEIGGLVVGADHEKTAILKQFGLALGLGFQVQDDWLGIWGKSDQTGKSTDSDILSRKKTLPILYALSQGGEFKEKWEKGPITVDEVPVMANLLIECGAQAYTQKMGDRLVIEAIKSLDLLGGPNEGLDGLHELIGGLSGRQK